MDTIIQPTSCVNANQALYTTCLPKRVECIKQPTTGRFVECGEQWNCNIPCQQDRPYFQPFLQGDLIQFQTLLFPRGSTPNDPLPFDDFIQVEICSNDGETYDVVGRKMSAWKNDKPYQILELDTLNLPCCFSLKYTNTQTGEELCTQEFECVCPEPVFCCKAVVGTNNSGGIQTGTNFTYGGISSPDWVSFQNEIQNNGGTIDLECIGFECLSSNLTICGLEPNVLTYDVAFQTDPIIIEFDCKVDEDLSECCKETFILQSKRTSRDCFGYCYGEPDNYTGDLIEYDNSLRFCGWIKKTGWSNEVERSDFNGKPLSEEVTETFQLGFSGKLAPYAAYILCNQLLTGGEICIDGEDYMMDGSSISNQLTSGYMWSFSVEIYQMCESNSFNCLN